MYRKTEVKDYYALIGRVVHGMGRTGRVLRVSYRKFTILTLQRMHGGQAECTMPNSDHQGLFVN